MYHGIGNRVFWQIYTDFAGEPAASIFRVVDGISRLHYERSYVSTSIRSAISQKTVIFIITVYQKLYKEREEFPF
jgi:hypothetical protein